MRPRRIKNQDEIINESSYIIEVSDKYKGKLHELFSNNNPIHLEIGVGKGDFIIGMAKKYPNINFIGIEVQDSVIVRAVKKLNQEELTNVKLMNVDAKKLNDIVDHEIEVLYLNFSDPWPKKRHAKRRLTSEEFLKIYDNIFIKDAHIIQKTDNIGLFAYSIEELVKHGYIFNKVSLDLANEDIDNVLTEYEQKFMKKDERINYLDAVKFKDK